MTPNECTDSSTTHSKPLDKCPTCGGAAWDHATWKLAREREHFARDVDRLAIDEREGRGVEPVVEPAPPPAAPTPPPPPADPVEVTPGRVEPARGNVGSRRARALRGLRVAADACARAGRLLATAAAALDDVLDVLDVLDE